MLLEAYAHQDVPLEKVMEVLRPQWNLSRPPPFRVTFRFDPVPGVCPKPQGLEVKPFEFEKGASGFDITLRIMEQAENLCCLFEYSTDLFEAATLTRMGGHFRRVLEGIVDRPHQMISDLPLLTEDECHQLFVEWNTVRDEDFEENFFYRGFESHAERSPDAVAVVFEDEQLTYRELNSRSNQLAHHLQALGVGPDVLVGICMERSPELVVAILGTHKAGGACVPLDPAFPKEWFAFALEDTRVSVILTQNRFLAKLPSHKGHVLCLDSNWASCAGESTDNPVSGVTSANLSFVYYTSGSTGIPKAVMLPHGE